MLLAFQAGSCPSEKISGLTSVIPCTDVTEISLTFCPAVSSRLEALPEYVMYMKCTYQVICGRCLGGWKRSERPSPSHWECWKAPVYSPGSLHTLLQPTVCPRELTSRESIRVPVTPGFWLGSASGCLDKKLQEGRKMRSGCLWAWWIPCEVTSEVGC